MTMDTTKQSVEGRGRLVHHRNAQFEFSQYGTRSREPSPHIMRDRLTRYASPSRCYKRDGDEIIPRVPQPYRTSFSAVTSPRRINIMPLKGKSQSTLSDALYNSPLRSSPPPQQTRSCDILSEPCQYIPTQAQSEAVESDSREWRNKMKHILGESKSSSCVLSDAPACSTCDNYSSCSNEVTVHGDTAAMFRRGSVEPSDDTTGNKPRTTIIQKEYVHAKNVIVDSKSHPMNDGKACDGHVEMNGKKKRSRSRLRNFAQRTRDSLKVLSGGSTTDAKKPPIKDTGRQLSPEGAPQSQAPSDDKAPRLNNSITRMFCRISHISPKSLRKSGSQRSESCSRHGNISEGSTMSSSSLHVHEAMDAKAHDATPGGATQKNKSRKPSPIRQLLRRRFSGGKSSEKNYTNGKENVPTMHQPSEQSPLPLQSVRILKTLDDGGGATHKKTVYQAFKEKQSNQRHAVPDTKPQAVRATCSPVLVPHQVAPSSPCKSPTVTELVVCPVQDVLVDATRRQHQPPCTLGVRDVAKMTKGVFLLSSMSVESIGQCSLDVHSIGSGTSLAPGTQVDSVEDGQAVSTAASKYVLNSKADDDASTKSSSEHMTVLSSDTTEHLTPCNDVIIVAAAHGDTSIDGSASSGSSKRNESPVVAPTAIVIPPTAHVPTPATDLKANGVVLHQNEMTDLESDGDAVDSCHIKQNGVLPFSPHPPISPKPERRVSPRDKRDAVTVSHQQPDAIVTNGDLKTTTENVENLTPDDKCVNHEVEHVCDANGEVAPLELTNTSRTAPVTTEEEMACKDGVYFLRVMQYERDHMDSLCDVTERLLKTPIPDEVAGKMRATVGKARLLTNKKFKQFHGLCKQQMEQDSNEKFKTTPQDLEGFWDMVLLQVDDVYTMFAEIEALRRNGWINTDETSVRSTPSVISDLGSIKSKSSGGKTKTTKPKEANSTRGTKKPSQQPSRNARDEARKRLLMAKRAGRQRKASHSETDVEIFVS